jgi:hypothetical protein
MNPTQFARCNRSVPASMNERSLNHTLEGQVCPAFPRARRPPRMLALGLASAALSKRYMPSLSWARKRQSCRVQRTIMRRGGTDDLQPSGGCSSATPDCRAQIGERPTPCNIASSPCSTPVALPVLAERRDSPNVRNLPTSRSISRSRCRWVPVKWSCLPVFLPVSREPPTETRSQLTASTAS